MSVAAEPVALGLKVIELAVVVILPGAVAPVALHVFLDVVGEVARAMERDVDAGMLRVSLQVLPRILLTDPIHPRFGGTQVRQ